MKRDKEDLFDGSFFQTVLNQLCTNIYITDPETDKIVYMNERMRETFHFSEDPVGKICWEILQQGMESRCEFCKIAQLEGAGGRNVCIWDEENTIDGHTYKNYDSMIEYGGKRYHLQSSTDITEYKRLSETASMDELTNMLNRRAGIEHLNEIMKKAKLEQKIITIALFDVNQLKTINDKYGHSEGDRLLKYVALITKEAMGQEDFVFRLSGDEFVVAFFNEGHVRADKKMRQILASLMCERDRFHIFYDVSFSYGLVEVYPGETHSTMEILAKVDDQMYIQKRAYHIKRAKEQLKSITFGEKGIEEFEYDKSHLYDALIAATDDYIFVGNMKTGTFRYPPAMVEEFGLPGQVVENAAAFWGELIHPHDEQYFLESNQEIADGRAEYHRIEYRAKNVRGEWIWLRCRGKMIRDEEGVPAMFAGMITNLGKKNQIDHMTGLFNRFEFEGDIKKYIVGENTAERLGIMMLDMDSFHNINDLYDKSYGDEILRITAQRISSMLPPEAKIYRMDGDEFGIIVYNGGIEECMRIYGGIHHTFCKQQEYNGRKYFCTLSAGCAQYPQDADNYLELLKYANYSLEASKSAGKNRITAFTPELLSNKERHLELSELLRESIERGFNGFSVVYQPQVDSLTGELYGAEALARWKCGKYGQVSPVEFIPLLESSGMIIPFGRWVFKTAAEQCRKWCEIKPDFHMNINLSYLQFLEGDIVGYMQKTLKELGLKPDKITMELTETYLVKEDIAVEDSINRMRQMGMQIAMDDFGVGYSSLNSLKNIPVDIVKIDRGFARDIMKDVFNETFVKAITELCHNVGKTVCLEGVETQDEYEVVKRVGLELIQGFYFGKPVTADEFENQFLL